MDQDIRARLEAWIDAHFDELLSDISELVAIPSVAGTGDAQAPYGEGCRRALDAALAMAQRYGFDTSNYENHCGSITLRPGKEAQDEIAFWGHLDVVPPGEGWLITPPYAPVIRDGYLVGRGSDDNKGPAVGVMYLLRAFEELGIKTHHGLRLFLGCDEEAGMKDVAYYADNYPASGLVIIPDCGFPVCYGEKGIITADIVTDAPMDTVLAAKNGMASNIVPDRAEITLRGECAQAEFGEYASAHVQDGCTRIEAKGLSRHSAFPEGGVNAIHEATKAALAAGLLSDHDRKALAFFTRINDDYLGTALGVNGEDEMSGYTTCTGTMTSMTEDGRMALHLNIRSHILADQDKLIANLEAVCRENGCTLQHVHASKGNYFPRENPVVDAMTAVFNEINGCDLKPYVMGGGTYARKLPNALGFGLGALPREATTLFAPGHGGAHQPDEGLHLSNFRKALLIFGMGILEADRSLAQA
ncbi:MAG: Sapep family Mn(2+)-dependent dipeptidase [Clostridia bacterium]|nr:Sapep family Mn(2+)-dependent dipeptidase [Clostridia bacterium]